jgi:hypothetical protein
MRLDVFRSNANEYYYYLRLLNGKCETWFHVGVILNESYGEFYSSSGFLLTDAEERTSSTFLTYLVVNGTELSCDWMEDIEIPRDFLQFPGDTNSPHVASFEVTNFRYEYGPTTGECTDLRALIDRS